jgi:hypothetical protein|tara:strand:+ start:2605 stop:2778 length:174 start_codon:yes stop_codon:yes gene_type:complete
MTCRVALKAKETRILASSGIDSLGGVKPKIPKAKDTRINASGIDLLGDIKNKVLTGP